MTQKETFEVRDLRAEGPALQTIPIGQLHDSPTNPRQRYDAARLKELTASVKLHGIIDPLLVRPLGDGASGAGKYEIVQGHRRKRAAAAAKLDAVPAFVRAMTDLEAMEVQLIELEQSEDVHPLEEALAYQRLIDAGQNVDQIAATIGMSASHVYQRLKLTELIPEARTAFLNGRLTAGHAVPIARLQPPDQKKCVGFALNGHSYGRDSAKLKVDGNEEAAMSVRELNRYIAEDCHLDLSKAPFPLADAMLVEKAGSCTACPKNTSVNVGLFPELAGKGAVCTDSACYHAKEAAYVDSEVSAAKEKEGEDVLRVSAQYDERGLPGVVKYDNWKPATGKKCPHQQTAIVAKAGWHEKAFHIGDRVKVCLNKKCKVHWNSGSGNRDIENYQAKERARQQKHAAMRRAREVAATRIAAKARWPIPPAEIRTLAVVMAHRLDFDAVKGAVKLMGWTPERARPFAGQKKGSFDYRKAMLKGVEALKPPELARWLSVCIMAPAVVRPEYETESKHFTELASRAGVDVKKLEREELKKKVAGDREQGTGNKKPAPKAKPNPRRDRIVVVKTKKEKR